MGSAESKQALSVCDAAAGCRASCLLQALRDSPDPGAEIADQADGVVSEVLSSHRYELDTATPQAQLSGFAWNAAYNVLGESGDAAARVRKTMVTTAAEAILNSLVERDCHCYHFEPALVR